MPKVDRLIVSGFGCLILLLLIGGLWHVSSYNHHQREHRERAAGYEVHGEDRYSRCAELGNDFERIACLVEQATAEQEQERGRADLNAQQDMATWAVALLWASVIGIVVSLAGIVLIYATLHETRAMTVATREIGESQTRAWVLFDGAGSGPVMNTEVLGVPVENGFNVRISFKNFGQSPAFVVAERADFILTEYDAPMPHFEAPVRPIEPEMILAQGGMANTDPFILNDNDSERIRRYEVAIAARVEIHYYTVFDQRDRSNPSILVITGWFRYGQRGRSGPLHFEKTGPQNRDR